MHSHSVYSKWSTEGAINYQENLEMWKSDIWVSILNKNIFTYNNGVAIYKYIYFLNLNKLDASPCTATIYYSLSYNSERLDS